MSKEKSAGAIIFRLENEKILYLVLHYPFSSKANKEYWDLAKGHIEQGESEKDTARREVQEETGLTNIEFFDGFREEIHYWFQWEGKKISKTVAFYLAQTKEKDVTISEEHIGFLWLPFKEAVEKLTYENAKQILQKARNFLSAKGI
jgi:bis(5'-nucleosidyl)-tetraphosphatase